MRKNLFRGKANSEIREGEWVFGSLLAESANTFPIIAREYDNDEDWISIDAWDTVEPQTVGQFTGEFDKHAQKIFEHDIVRKIVNGKELVGVVQYKDGAFGVKFADGSGQFLCFFADCCDVLGNIHDNPEWSELLNN